MKKTLTLRNVAATACLVSVITLLSAVTALAQPTSQGCNARFTYRADSILANTVNFRANMHAPNAGYSWDFGDGATATGNAPQHTYAAPGSYYACLTITRTDSLGNDLCSSAFCNTVYIYATPPPCDAHFTADQNLNSGMVHFVGTLNSSIAAYAWNYGDGNTDSGRVTNHRYDVAGTYYVCLTVTRTDSTGAVICTSTQCDSVYAAEANPGNNAVVCLANFRYESRLGDPTARFLGGFFSGGNAIYSWDFGDGAIGDTKNPEHTYQDTGVYYVCCNIMGMDESGNVVCTSDYCDSVYVGTDHVPGPVGNEFGELHRLSNRTATASAGVFPNPVTSRSMVSVNNFNGPVRFRVFNQSGQIVLERNYVSNGSYAFDASILSSGIYSFQVTDGQQLVQGKVVVQ
ncbi:MAG: hypothetical protein RL213_1904 [Bacteroidota bacterium]|jgi:PKD repeat protein